MKQNEKLISPHFMTSPELGERQSPTLHDSKSFSYLPNLTSSVKDNNRFRETTYYPVSPKNMNYEFLRYSVNPAKNPRETPIKGEVKTPNHIHRKMTHDHVEMPEEPKSRKYGHLNKQS